MSSNKKTTKKKTKRSPIHPCNEGYGNCGSDSCRHCNPLKKNVSKLAKAIVADVLCCVDAYGQGFTKGSDGKRSLVVSSVLTDTTIESGVRVMERRVHALLSKKGPR